MKANNQVGAYAPETELKSSIAAYDEKLFGVLQPECSDCRLAGMLIYRLSDAVVCGLVSETDAVILVQDLNEDCSAGRLRTERSREETVWLVGALVADITT